jgi:hypothetical protein
VNRDLLVQMVHPVQMVHLVRTEHPELMVQLVLTVRRANKVFRVLKV